MRKQAAMGALVLFSLALLAGLAYPQENSKELTRAIAQARQERDAEMPKGDELPDADKKGFAGLHYFPIDLTYRFHAVLHRIGKADYFDMIASDGRVRQARRYGYFEFTVKGTPCRLYVYRLTDVAQKYPHLLFVPFTDGTTNVESYGGGRYLDLDDKPTDEHVLDFNLAYNPSCAYGRSTFSCPIPPAENRLGVRIEAGEKKWKH